MRISVVIPVLNEQPIIEQSCQRALRLGAHEVIVADGGSTDQTQSIAHGCGCELVTSDAGRGAQQNAGARRATGDVLLFLHADTWLAHGNLQQIEAALRDPHVVAGGFYQRIEAVGWCYRALEKGNALRVRCCKLPFGDQGIFVRRQVFEELGGFPQIPLLEDVHLMRRVRQVGAVALLPGPLYVSARRWRRHGVVRQTLRNWGILAADRAGVSPHLLAHLYRRHDL